MNRLCTTTRLWTFCASAVPGTGPAGRLLVGLVAATVTAGVWLATPAWADPFLFSTGTPDGRLGALSQAASTGHLETETADDFILTKTTSIAQATITGLIRSGTPLANISNVEIEVYHIFPADSADPPSQNVPSRANSPADVEIDSATRDGSLGTLVFDASLLDESFSVLNTVADGINPAPGNVTDGEGPASGEAVQITITFTPPIVLAADHYFFRPAVQVANTEFLYLSAAKPIVAPGTPFVGDLQAWIRNSDLKPDWLRIGTDIIGGTPAATFNMALSLAGETVPTCVGDCDNSGAVTIDELVKGVSIALGTLPLDQCPQFDCTGTGQVTIDCLITGVSAALNGCQSASTGSSTPSIGTATPTRTLRNNVT
jgi:hypothetical protein